MAWMDKIFSYCERATDPSFWAEPINAVTNIAFIIASALALKIYLKLPPEQRHPLHVILISLVFLIGIGSGLFHTFADKWSVLADVIPITLFIYVYLYLALTWFLKLSWWQSALALIAFFGLSALTSNLSCSDGLVTPDFDSPSAQPCLNGGVAYIPPLAALIVIGAILHVKNHSASQYFFVAAAVFTLSLTLRTIDNAACSYTNLVGKEVGTHFFWHLLNAIVLYSLLRAALMPQAASNVSFQNNIDKS